MKKYLLIALLAAGALTSCQRSHREVWEDTKTCGRYMNKGLRSFFGKHLDSRECAGFYDYWNEGDEGAQFERLQGSERLATLSMDETMPQPKDSPGDPGSPIPGLDSFSTPAGRLAQLFTNIHFETDHYTVNGSENLHILKEVADYLVRNPRTYVFVEGHADERGAAAYNLALGAKRANSVRGFLIQNGVSPDQLFTTSFGKERPLVSGHDEFAWHQNRRAEFKIYEK